MTRREPLARYATLTGILDVATDIGLNVNDLFAPSILDPIGLTQPDRWVPAIAIADLLEDAAARSGHDDVGLRLAEMRHLPNLGPLSLVIREEPDLRAAVQTLIRYPHMYHEAVQIRLDMALGRTPPSRQSIELAVATLAGILADLAGASWQPLATCFRHSRPADTSRYSPTFGTNLVFDHAFNGIVLRSADLAVSNALANPLLLPYAQLLLNPGRDTADDTVIRRTREVIELLLPAGQCSIDRVARGLGVSRRTLHRQLQSAGTTFTELLDATRMDLVSHLLAKPDNSFTDISLMLMFSTPGNFTRWFRQRFGMTPRAWRQQRDGVS